METASKQLSVFAEQLIFEENPLWVLDRVKLHILDIVADIEQGS